MKNNKITLWGGVWILIIASIIVLIFIGRKPEIPPDGISNDFKEVTERDHIRGDINAKITLVEYSDFQCPACKAYYPLIKNLEERFGADFAMVYRHFPLIQVHPNAQPSAMATEVAGLQGKFWEMHDMIFENQEDWSDKSNAKEIFTNYARELGLDEERFANDLNSKELEEKVLSGYKEAVALGLNGTPTFFLNGRLIANPRTLEDFEKIISEEINSSSL